jgi:hypothetical protein
MSDGKYASIGASELRYMVLSSVKQNGYAAIPPATILKVYHSVVQRFQQCNGDGSEHFQHL